MSWYVGAGAWVGVAENRAKPFFELPLFYYVGPRVWVAARGNLGVNLALAELPIEFYLEGNPALVVFPGISFGMGLSAGLRFYF